MVSIRCVVRASMHFFWSVQLFDLSNFVLYRLVFSLLPFPLAEVLWVFASCGQGRLVHYSDILASDHCIPAFPEMVLCGWHVRQVFVYYRVPFKHLPGALTRDVF